jgi:hypothetical protein
LEEGALAKEVTTAIAGEAEFWEDDDLGTFGGGLLERLDNQESVGRGVT